MQHKFYSLMMVAALTLSLIGCGSTAVTMEADAAAATEPESAQTTEPTPEPSPEPTEEPVAAPTELIVFAAASMTETLTALQEVYEATHPEVSIIYNFDSSGTLKTQIEEGADCDLFISAGQKQMNQLDITADPEINTDGLDFVDESTRMNLLENKVALVVAPACDTTIDSFDALAQGLRNGKVFLAMGNSDVPVGQYTQKILAYYELNEEELANAGGITYGTNVKEVTTQVTESAVDCGVIYATDAYSAGLPIIDTAAAEMCGQVIYPAAVLKTAANPEAAKAFLQFLTESEASAEFEKVGFTPLN